MRTPQRSKTLTVLARIVIAWTAVLIVMFSFNSDEGTFGYLAYRIPLLVGLVVLVLGMRWRERRPGFALALITIGALMPAITYWLLPLYAPIGALLIFNAFISTPRVGRAHALST